MNTCILSFQVSNVDGSPTTSKYLLPWLLDPKMLESSNLNNECLILILDFSGLLPG